MAIKPDADAAHFDDHVEQRPLALQLDESFDITFAKKHGDAAFWLADPKPHVRERFGLQQEVMVAYSPHPTTDARVLTMIEQVSRHPDFKHRIDRVLYLLVHNGDPVETAALTRRDPDRIIVPLHVAELLDASRGSLFLRQRIAQCLGELDLFGISSPITSDKYFFGRDELVQELLVRATVKSNNSGLFGLRKTGKTSVLKALQRRLRDRPIIAEYVDCSNPGFHSARWWQLLEHLVVRVSESLVLISGSDTSLL